MRAQYESDKQQIIPSVRVCERVCVPARSVYGRRGGELGLGRAAAVARSPEHPRAGIASRRAADAAPRARLFPIRRAAFRNVRAIIFFPPVVSARVR